MTSTPDSTPRPAHPETARLQDAFRQGLNFADQADFEDARRGFVGSIEAGEVTNAKGQVVSSMRKLEFIQGEQAPDTVNPSLWRLARLNTHHGLFEVTDRTYQVRGLDIANITFTEGERGVIVIDPATFVESAAAALALYRQHRATARSRPSSTPTATTTTVAALVGCSIQSGSTRVKFR